MFYLAKTKTYQEGIKYSDYPWHVYSDPLEPVVCPLLVLARYIIAHPYNLTGQRNLFEVHSRYECFNKIFNEVVVTHRYEFEYLSISVEDFGTYSIRKGAAIFSATRCTVSPPTVHWGE